jgi:hypothetical protein
MMMLLIGDPLSGVFLKRTRYLGGVTGHALAVIDGPAGGLPCTAASRTMPCNRSSMPRHRCFSSSAPGRAIASSASVRSPESRCRAGAAGIDGMTAWLATYQFIRAPFLRGEDPSPSRRGVRTRATHQPATPTATGLLRSGRVAAAPRSASPCPETARRRVRDRFRARGASGTTSTPAGRAWHREPPQSPRSKPAELCYASFAVSAGRRVTVNADCWHALPMGIRTTLMLPL